jgi:hypothetical protein
VVAGEQGVTVVSTSAAVGWLGRRLSLAAAALVIFVVALVVVVQGAVTSGPPFAVQAMHPRVTLVVTDESHAQGVVDRMVGPGRLSTFTGRLFRARSQLVGQVDFRTLGRPSDSGELALFVIDNRTHTPLQTIEAIGPAGSNVGQGWDGRFQRLADKYDWLKPLAAVRDSSGGFTDPGMAVVFRPATKGPITFAAVVGADALPLADPAKDLTFVLAYVGDSHGAWATRVPVTIPATPLAT